MEENTYIMGTLLPGHSHHHEMNSFSAFSLSLEIQFRQGYNSWLCGEGMK